MSLMLNLPRLFFAAGAIGVLPAELALLGARRPLLVTDQGLVRHGVAGRARAVLAGGPPHAVFDTVPENPTNDGVDRAVTVFRAEGCDSVVALGGGSVIDTAKLVAVIGGHGGTAADFVGRSERVTGAVVPLIVVPTTAGTGSEASPDAGIHPTANSVSSGISSRHAVPRVAICDPELTVTLPPRLTAATGLDALSHCIEAYLSTTHAPPLDALALDGIGRACRHVEQATADGRDLAARSEMMMAAFEGGATIGKGLGPAHAVAIACGDQGLHHGVLSAIGLLASLPVVGPHVPDRMRTVAAAMGLAGGETVVGALRGLMRRLGLPLTLREAGYRPGDLGAVAREALATPFNRTSPYVPTEAEYETMIRSVLG